MHQKKQIKSGHAIIHMLLAASNEHYPNAYVKTCNCVSSILLPCNLLFETVEYELSRSIFLKKKPLDCHGD